MSKYDDDIPVRLTTLEARREFVAACKRRGYPYSPTNGLGIILDNSWHSGYAYIYRDEGCVRRSQSLVGTYPRGYKVMTDKQVTPLLLLGLYDPTGGRHEED